MVNYYDILGVSENASQEEIKKAFKDKAKTYHPDRHQGDANMEEVFKIINEAYQTLSNPYSRSNYDMMRRYGHHHPSEPRSNQAPPRPVYRPPVRRAPRFNSKENIQATLYAFLFAFIIAAIIKTGIYFVETHRAEEYARELRERRDFFNRVRDQKEAGNLSASLKMIESMGYFRSEERDMRDFKDRLVYDIRDVADEHLNQGEFESAIEYYNMLSDYSVSSTINYMLKMAKAYQGLGNYEETLRIYRVLQLYGYENASFYYDMGNLYETAGNLSQALNYYTLSADKAASEYEVTIGKAYPVVITASMIPSQHYDIYLKVSEMHLSLSQYEAAIKSVAWSKEIWPDSIRLYHIAALSHQALGQTKQMNANLRAARKIDPLFKL